MTESDDKKQRREASVRAVQVAFEMERRIAGRIRIMAAREGLSPSDQIRKLIGLSYSPPQRPRLTVRLSPEDYVTLGARYHIDAENKQAIRKAIAEELNDACGEE